MALFKRILKYFFIYIVFYSANAGFVAKIQFTEFGRAISGNMTFMYTKIVWTAIAFLINFMIFYPFLKSKKIKNKFARVIVFLLVCFVGANVFFWASVIPGAIVYFSLGGAS